LKKPSSFNPFEKAVPIQAIWKNRPHSDHLEKPSPFNPFEKAVPNSTQSKKPSPFNPFEKAVVIQLI
jgi:hypothetical protein